VTLLGTGINPGYAMDALALFLSGVCQHVEQVHIRRALDAATRRLPLQKKIGAGLSVQEFEKLVEGKKVRHVGLIEAVAMIAAGLGWGLDKIDEIIEPAVADRVLKSEYLQVQPGQVAGVHQVARGYAGGREVLTLDLTIALGVADPGDFIRIKAEREVEMVVKGIHGDQATAAVVVNTVPRVVQAAPGLLTMKDIALPACWSAARQI
jgi:4-hydroxy-tetrahydrodipicolinate reductase